MPKAPHHYENNPPEDWKDRYYIEREKNEALKRDVQEKDTAIKLLQTKIRRLEADLNKIDHTMGVTTPRKNTIQIENENEALITQLKSKIAGLKIQNQQSLLKQKEMSQLVESLKRDKASLLRRQNALKNTNRNSSSSIGQIEAVPAQTNMHQRHPIPPEPTPTIRNESPNDANLLKIVHNYKVRLAAAEEEVARMRSEHENRPIPVPIPGSLNVDRDTLWKLQQLQTQHDHIQSKYAAQEEAYRKLDKDQLEYQQKVRDLRHALEDLRHEKSLIDTKAAKAESLQEAVDELKEANRALEKKYAQLCEVQYTPGDGMRSGMISRFDHEELIKDRDDLKGRVEHLQEAVRTHFSALTTLKKQAAKLREEKDHSDRKTSELQEKFREMRSGKDLVQEQLRLYSGDDGLDMETLEKAITIVKRRQEAFDRLSFLENPDEETLDTLPAIKKKLEQHQHINVKLTTENEKLENMLNLQAKINKDLHQEIEQLVHHRTFDKREMEQQIESYERLATKRLEVIRKLEAQVRQFVYGKSKKALQAPKEPGEEVAIFEGLFDASSYNLKPDENVLEIWVKSAHLIDGKLMPGSSSFTVIDFFDYESQATPIINGNKPVWDFAATYRLTIDDFLIRFFATECVSLELNMAAQGDYLLMGSCAIPLAPLLRSSPLVKLKDLPIQSADSDELIGHITVQMRLAMPISELYNLFLERHPDEKAAIKAMASVHPLTDEPSPGSGSSKIKQVSSSMNQLEITIHRASSLPKNPASGQPPTCYVHFQFLGHPDRFTHPAHDTCEPEFDETFVFPMSTDEHQLRLLERTKLLLSLVDIKVENNKSAIKSSPDGSDSGLIGEVYMGLSSLCDGTSIADVFAVKNLHGQKVADMQISIRWRKTFKNKDTRPPRGQGGQSLGGGRN